MLPFEFIVFGRPVSSQTRDKTRLRVWQAQVQQVAAKAWGDALPTEEAVHIQLTYYFDAPNGKEDMVPDSDNIVKPIREALRGVVYLHNHQVTDVVSRRRNLNSSFRIRGISPVLAAGFTRGSEFVHVKIEDAPDPSDLT